MNLNIFICETLPASIKLIAYSIFYLSPSSATAHRELSHNDFDAERCTASIRNLSNLVELKLNQNKLTRIPLFVGLISLQRLDLASNQIDEISSDALMALPQLNHLDLSRNAIHTIAPGTFYRGNRLRKL